MSRLVGTGDKPGKTRRAHQRSCAEVLRLLAEHPVFDAEGRDMAAFLVFNLRGIYRSIDESAMAWDDRNYWKKAEALREKWRWARITADEMERLIVADAWHEMPDMLISLVPYFSSIRITTVTRSSDWWCGAYRALLKEAETPQT